MFILQPTRLAAHHPAGRAGGQGEYLALSLCSMLMSYQIGTSIIPVILPTCPLRKAVSLSSPAQEGPEFV